ncbi:uncharacterized protein LOC119720242 [Patiria miniata]|uniref:Uncharacterized protein n=1 Tax=Patiria miniata TaxID=46514 RepID=A0A913Z4X2_PATMI|nr:uncharacterized protein LOC119720242 [Patiria miniata]
MDKPPPTKPLCTSTLKRPHEDNVEVQLEGPRVKRSKVKGQNITLGSRSMIENSSSSTWNANFGRGQVKLAVYWSQTHLLVHIFGARQLYLKNDKDCNSYIQISVLSSDGIESFVQRTKMIPSDRQPAFNETLTFHRDVFHSTNSRLLIVACNQTSTRIESIGSMSFGIVRLLNGNKEVNGWYHLLDKKRGREKHLAVKINPITNEHLNTTGTVDQSDDSMNRANSILPWISLHYFDIEKDSQGKYGFTILDTVPVKVGTVHKGSVAETLGLQSDDAFLEVGGHSVAGVRSIVIIDLLKKANGPLCVLLQRKNTVPFLRSPLVKKSLNRPTQVKPQVAVQSPKPKRKAAKVLSPRIEAFLSRSKPIVDRRLQRELFAKVALRNARQNQHKCLQTSSSCSSTYSSASTATLESRRGSGIRKHDSLKRHSLDWRRLNRCCRDRPASDLTNDTSQRASAVDSDIGIMTIHDDDDTTGDRNSTSSWESDVMATIPVDDLSILESVLDKPQDSQEPDDTLLIDLNFPPTFPPADHDILGASTASAAASSAAAAAATSKEENKRKRKHRFFTRESRAGNSRKHSGRSGRSGLAMEIPLHNDKQHIVWSRRVTPIPLGPPWRQLVHKGRVFVQSKTKKLREMLLLLYTDVLLFTKPLDEMHIKVVCCPLVINEISVLDFNCQVAREFHITLVTDTQPYPLASHGGTICLRAPTTKLKSAWHRLLQQRIMAVKCTGQDAVSWISLFSC